MQVNSRAVTWMLMTVSSVIVFGATADIYVPSERNARIKWTMAITFIIACLSFLVTLYTLFTKGNKMMELGLSFVFTMFWIFVVDTYCNPLRNYGTMYQYENSLVFETYLPNPFLFTWLFFLSGCYCMGLCFGDNKKKIADTVLVAVVSMIVFIKAAVIKNRACAVSDYMCGSTKLCIASGVISMVFALGALAMMKSNVVSAGASFVCMVMSFLAVAWGTSSGGPAMLTGTLYFSLWIAALASTGVFFQSLSEMKNAGSEGDK
jgi:hypothetical protein